MHKLLRLLGAGGRSNHADAQRELIYDRPSFADQAKRGIEPARIRPIQRIGHNEGRIGRREDCLLNRIFGADLAPVGKERQLPGEIDRPFGCALGRGDPTCSNPTRVALVGSKKAKAVIFHDERKVALVVRFWLALRNRGE